MGKRVGEGELCQKYNIMEQQKIEHSKKLLVP